MNHLAMIELFADPQQAASAVSFRPRDRYSLGDRRRCVRLAGGTQVTFSFDRGPVRDGTAELCLTGSLEVHDSQAYARKFLNSLLEVRINETVIFDGLLHWRSHEETAAYWPTFDFAFAPALLRPGLNTVTIANRTSRAALGEFFDVQLLKEFDATTAERKLTTILLSGLEVRFGERPPAPPCLRGVPGAALAGRSFIIEVSTGAARQPLTLGETENAAVQALGSELEFGEYRSLFALTPACAGRPVWATFYVAGVELIATVPRIYADTGAADLITGPGAETTYWHQLKRAAQDFFALESGNCLRVSIDDFLNNLHIIPVEQWLPFIRYLVRRRRYYALQRLRVPPYSRIQHRDLQRLADLGGDLFAGVAMPEPHHFLRQATQEEGDLARRQARYLELFKKMMDEVRLPGHRIVTFDVAGSLSYHYYALGLDAHLSEIGPSCNVFQEACNRGAARVWGKPWGVATAMHWYCGQGAQYAYDDARVRYAWLTMLHSYLAGARQILWEGGVLDNLPVYNFILSEESWRDFGRRYDHPALVAVRNQFRELLEFHRAQQLPQPRARFGFVRGIHDTAAGYDVATSRYGDLSMARAWTLLRVFLPHVCLGPKNEPGRPVRRWYSATPFGQVDVVPAEAAAGDFGRYALLAFTGWNTMTPELYRKLITYVSGGGILFISTAHFAVDTVQELEWHFLNDGDLTELCGVRVRDLGGRIEDVTFTTDEFARHLPARLELTHRNPLFIENFDETYPVFERDVTCFGGQLEVTDAKVLAVSQRGEPVVLRRRLGQGQVCLLNSYAHPGRGHFLTLAEGLLRTLAESVPAPLRLTDPTQVVSWFEYPAEGCTRYVFLNTDWTHADAVVEATVTLGQDTIPLRLAPGCPVQVVSDGVRHVVLTDPAAQLVSWRQTADVCELTVLNGEPAAVHGSGPAHGLRLNGQPWPQ